MTPDELEAGAIGALASVDPEATRRVVQNAKRLGNNSPMDHDGPLCTNCEAQYADGTYEHSEVDFQSDEEIHVRWSCRNCGHLNTAIFSFTGQV